MVISMTNEGLNTNSPNLDTNNPPNISQLTPPPILNHTEQKPNSSMRRFFSIVIAVLLIIFGLIKLNGSLPEFVNFLPLLNDLIINQLIKHTFYSDLEGNIGTIRYLSSNFLTAVYSTFFVIAGFFIILNKPNRRKIVLLAVFFAILQVILSTILGFFSGGS